MALSEQLVKGTKRFVDYVTKAVDIVHKAGEAGRKALEAFAKYTRENIIGIKHICFNTTLENVKDACFGFKVDLVFGGKHKLKFDTNACINVGFIQTVAKSIADKVLPGIGKVKEKLKSAKNYIMNIGWSNYTIYFFLNHSSAEN